MTQFEKPLVGSIRELAEAIAEVRGPVEHNSRVRDEYQTFDWKSFKETENLLNHVADQKEEQDEG